MSTLEIDGWELVSAEESPGRPGGFDLPPLDERCQLAVGTRAKLSIAFRIEVAGAQVIVAQDLWCEVEGAAAGRHVASLITQAKELPTLRPGDRIEFGPEHVASFVVPKQGTSGP